MAKRGPRPQAADQHMADELVNWVANTEPLYRQRQAMEGAIAKHLCRGAFTTDKAIKGFRHVVDNAAKQYAREFGMGSRGINGATRNAAAKDLVGRFKQAAQLCLRSAKHCGDVSASAAATLRKKTCIAKPSMLAGARRGRR